MILFLFLKLNSILKISFALSESRLPVGSSANIISGLLINALAIAIRWFSPPDNSFGKWFILDDIPTFFNNFFASSMDFCFSLETNKLGK